VQATMTPRDSVAALGDRFSTHYSIWGAKLDLDRLLADARPRTKYDVWRRGDATALETPALTAGLRIEVFDGSSAGALEAAVKRFLKREAGFLQAARSRARSTDHSGLTTVISVGSSEEIPIGLELSASLLDVIAKARVTWTVTVSVFADGTGRAGAMVAK
jgi:hypothetical protein